MQTELDYRFATRKADGFDFKLVSIWFENVPLGLWHTPGGDLDTL
jgi:hypothetical protein